MKEETSFEEMFPSLKEMILKETTIDIISHFCLDKQKVREAIDDICKHKHFSDTDNCGYNWNIWAVHKFLMKELGLDD